MDQEFDLARCLAGHPEIRLAILFGSATSGRQTFESDVDVAVAARRALSAAERVEIVGRLAQATGRAVDLVDLTTASGPILNRALATGRLLFCTDRALYAEIIKRALYDDADLAPYRRRILAARRKAWIGA
jgi:predicted nucleotidyltransferase